MNSETKPLTIPGNPTPGINGFTPGINELGSTLRCSDRDCYIERSEFELASGALLEAPTSQKTPLNRH